jgi:hypothetical protein
MIHSFELAVARSVTAAGLPVSVPTGEGPWAESALALITIPHGILVASTQDAAEADFPDVRYAGKQRPIVRIEATQVFGVEELLRATKEACRSQRAVAAAAIPISIAGQPAPSYCDQKQFEALRSEARQCVQLAAIRRAINSTAGANDIAIAAVEDCAGDIPIWRWSTRSAGNSWALPAATRPRAKRSVYRRRL